MIDKLVCLHEEYGLYNGFKVNQKSWEPKIVKRLSENKDTKYLTEIYLKYLDSYRVRLGSRFKNSVHNSNETGVSRTVDFPFFGSKIIERKKACYFLVFEGSLANIQEPSITVLSCLWATTNSREKSKILAEFWPGRGEKSFEYIVKCLRMNHSIAEYCYVTDAVRIGNGAGKPDLNRNRELLHREIEILNPEYVILLGSKAKSTYGKYSNKNSWQVIYLPFPTKNYKSNEKIEILENSFELLEKEVWST